MQLPQSHVDPLEGHLPFVAVPTVCVASLVYLAHVQVGEPGFLGGVGGDAHAFVRIVMANVIGAAQRRTGQRGRHESGQPHAGGAVAGIADEREHSGFRLQFFGMYGTTELDELTQRAGAGIELRVAGHACQSWAGAGAEGGHGRRGGAWRACADRTLVERFVHE